MEYLSAESPEFLEPIYAALDSGKPIVIQAALSRTGGSRNEFLIRSRKEFDEIRQDTWCCWRPEARITVCYNVEVVWDGKVTFETLKLFWDRPELIESVSSYGQSIYDSFYLNPISGVFEWLMEHKNKQVLIVKDNFGGEDCKYGYVPCGDGIVKAGSY